MLSLELFTQWTSIECYRDIINVLNEHLEWSVPYIVIYGLVFSLEFLKFHLGLIFFIKFNGIMNSELLKILIITYEFCFR